jgi:hypothetical protein
MSTALQWMEEASSSSEADEILAGMAFQDGYLGGWILPPMDITPAWRVQGFLSADGVPPRSWLPDGLRYVTLPPGISRRLAALREERQS